VRLAVEHEDKAKIALALEIQERYPPETEADSAVLRVLDTGSSEFYPEITAEMLEAVARDEEHLALLRELGFTSVIIVPMVARGRTLGAISLVSAESRRRYGETDLGLAEDLAQRAALAVDNARLYEEAQREIAEREWSQSELRASRDELEVILGGITDGVTAQDPTGRLFYANEMAARTVGFPSARALVDAPPREVLEKFEVLDPEGRPFPLDDLPGRRALRGEGASEEIVRFRILATGEERWSVVNAAPVFRESGEIRMVVNIFRDITEMRRSEADRARLAAIVESSDDIIIGKTLEGTITSWNKGAETAYGYSAEEAVGSPISMLVPPERPDEIPMILDSVRRGEKVDHFETVRVAKDGRRLDISLTVSPIRDRAGNVVGASTIARDITEQKRAEEALRESREVERRRIARDLHDSVLQDLSYTAAAMGLITLEVEDPALELRLQRAIDAVRRAAQGLRDAVNNLRLEDEQDRPFPDLVGALVKRNLAMAPGLEIGLEVEEGFPTKPLGAAGTEPLRIIQEALTNARRHSGATKVLVSLRMEGDDLVAEVSDDGRGFGREAAPGVGLSSMRERAAAIDATLRIESSPGRGTNVRLRVTLEQKG
jgi:PAS domain S-box-containing protein